MNPPSSPNPPDPPDDRTSDSPELEMEHEAAALMQAWAQRAPVAVPAGLRERVQREGKALVEARQTAVQTPASQDSSFPLWAFLGGFAAAAALALAAVVGFGVLNPPANTTVVQTDTAATNEDDPTPDPAVTAAGFQQLLNAANVSTDPDHLAAYFQPSPDAPAEASGEVVWLADQQRSVLRLRGLPANDPAQTQYQLWVVDPTRDSKHPVDGGVFDVSADDTTLVAVDAKLPVDRPTLFAITREQPGGVVVSDGPMLLVAQVTPG